MRRVVRGRSKESQPLGKDKGGGKSKPQGTMGGEAMDPGLYFKSGQFEDARYDERGVPTHAEEEGTLSVGTLSVYGCIFVRVHMNIVFFFFMFCTHTIR